jgi:hypothetical protein
LMDRMDSEALSNQWPQEKYTGTVWRGAPVEYRNVISV